MKRFLMILVVLVSLVAFAFGTVAIADCGKPHSDKKAADTEKATDKKDDGDKKAADTEKPADKKDDGDKKADDKGSEAKEEAKDDPPPPPSGGC